MDYYLLFDQEGKYLEFVGELSAYPLKAIKSPARGGKLKRWTLGCLRALRASRRGDAVVCWFDFQAVMLFWMCRLTMRRREIFAINIMLKERRSPRNRVAALLYRPALTSRCFHASVTSPGYGQWLNRRLGVEVEYSLVRDVMLSFYLTLRPDGAKAAEPRTVFSGGHNGRDWPFMLRLAEAMPDARFHFVAGGDVCKRLEPLCPANVTLEHDISAADFAARLCGCQVLCQAVDTEAPSGLITLFQAAAYGKPVFMTRTATSSAYVTPERGYPLPRDIEAWKAALNQAFARPEEMALRAERMREFVAAECSEEKFVAQLDQMISKHTPA